MPTHPGDVGWRGHMALPVTLVQCCCTGVEEGWNLEILYRLQMSECPYKEGFTPNTQMPETMESLVGARYFSTMDLKSSFWQVKVS